jgi:acyl-CoA synthetase (AMP-forming)/AMP-acid ligase II
VETNSFIETDTFFPQYTSQDTIVKYSRATAGYGINYLLDHDYKSPYLEAFQSLPAAVRQKGSRLPRLISTARSFVVPPGQAKVYYRTRDRVRLPADGKPITYLGRVDNQIKVLGYRVELGEVEAALRQESGVAAAIAVGWPISPSGAGGIEAFLQTEYADIPSLREKLTKRLPPYMVPRNIHLVGKMPLNSNGKFDRRALIHVLEEQQR